MAGLLRVIDGARSVAVLGTASWFVRPSHWKTSLPSAPVDVVVLVNLDARALDAATKRVAAWKKTRLVVCFENAIGALNLVSALSGVGAETPLNECTVEQVLHDRGFHVTARHGFRGARPTLAADTVAALARLFEQLNASAQDDHVLLEATVRAPAKRARKKEFTAGLVSVVMRNHSLTRVKMLEQALFSLACQNWPSLEVVMVTQSQERTAAAELEAVLAKYQALGNYEFKVLKQPSNQDIRARLANLGLKHASGQYVSFLDDDDVIYPQHYERLVQALRESGAAWAFAPVRRAYFKALEDGELFCKTKDVFPRSEALDLAQLMHDNYVTCHSYVVDRTRLGRFALGFEERLDKGEDYALLLRLLALFRPVAVGGAPSAEYRIRDDGTNTIIHDTDDAAARARLIQQWKAATELKDRITADLQMLVTRSEFVQETRRGLSDEAERAPEELRYRLADFANRMLKRGLPFVHQRVKRTLNPRIPGK
ncbi:MAG: glycosyltransferase family 2 protein [Archangium sp.]